MSKYIEQFECSTGISFRKVRTALKWFSGATPEAQLQIFSHDQLVKLTRHIEEGRKRLNDGSDINNPALRAARIAELKKGKETLPDKVAELADLIFELLADEEMNWTLASTYLKRFHGLSISARLPIQGGAGNSQARGEEFAPRGCFRLGERLPTTRSQP